jgi:hypothetical protein
MKDRITVKIQMEPHLKAFLISVYRQDPVFFPKKDKLNDLLLLLLAKQPRDLIPKDPQGPHLEIILPYFENLNIMTYNYLSEQSRRTFLRRVRMIFWCTFEDFMDECFRNDMGRTESIGLFIEKYNLPLDDKIEDTLRKQIYRSKRIFRKYPKRDYKRVRKTAKILSDK